MIREGGDKLIGREGGGVKVGGSSKVLSNSRKCLPRRGGTDTMACEYEDFVFDSKISKLQAMRYVRVHIQRRTQDYKKGAGGREEPL